jgi:hypothetical protein
LPGLINNKQTLFLISANDIPNVAEDNIHGNWPQFILEVTNIKYHHGVVDVDIGLLAKDTCESAGSVLTQSLSELRAVVAHMK